MAWNLGLLGGAAGGVAGAYNHLETTVLATAASSVTFSGLASYASDGYKHLQIRASTRSATTGSANQGYITFNGDTTVANYSRHSYQSTGVTDVPKNWGSGWPQVTLNSATGYDSNGFSVSVIDIINPFDSNQNTIVKSTNGMIQPTNLFYISNYMGAWLNTASVTSLTVFENNQNQDAKTRFSLYGWK